VKEMSEIALKSVLLDFVKFTRNNRVEVIKKDPPQWVIDEVEEYNKDCIAQEKLAEKGIFED